MAAISLAVMAIKLAAGNYLNSLALVSDGVHTATHAAVMTVAGAAYLYARRRADDPRFRLGTGKVTDLAAFASGVILAMTAAFLAVESVGRLFAPEPVRFQEAAAVTGVGLAVSLLSAVLLRRSHEIMHIHAGHEDVASHATGRDLNLWAAYLHMVADVITSVISLIALAAGAMTGWTRLDPAVGLLNAAVVAWFSLRLLKAASAALLDYDPLRKRS